VKLSKIRKAAETMKLKSKNKHEYKDLDDDMKRPLNTSLM